MLSSLFFLSVVLAIASQFPQQLSFVGQMTLVVLLPLAVAATLLWPFARWGSSTDNRLHLAEITRQSPIASWLIRPIHFLGLWRFEDTTSLTTGITTAIISTVTLVGLWPVIREIGL